MMHGRKNIKLLKGISVKIWMLHKQDNMEELQVELCSLILQRLTLSYT